MNLFQNRTAFLHPENTVELTDLSKKWNITIQELGRAIVETGTTNIKELRRYIRRNKSGHHHNKFNPGISDLAISK